MLSIRQLNCSIVRQNCVPPSVVCLPRASCSLPVASTSGTHAASAVTNLAVSQERSKVFRPSQRGISTRCQAFGSDATPFEMEKYHRVQFYTKPYGPITVYQDPRQPSVFNAALALRREVDAQEMDAKILEVFVAGDAAINIYTLLSGKTMERPMCHDLLHAMMRQAQAGSPRQWRLLHVAITELRNDVFIGRLYFGDPETGVVSWDCDCRPSDGIFLSIKAKAPLYVHRDVWRATSKPVSESTVHRLLTESAALSGGSTASGVGPYPQLPIGPQITHAPVTTSVINDSASAFEYTMLRPDDLEEIKLLKQKLAVAVKMEDYRMCAQLRDHPWLVLYKEAFTNKAMGRYEEAERYELKLRNEVQKNAMLTRD